MHIVQFCTIFHLIWSGCARSARADEEVDRALLAADKDSGCPAPLAADEDGGCPASRLRRMRRSAAACLLVADEEVGRAAPLAADEEFGQTPRPPRAALSGRTPRPPRASERRPKSSSAAFGAGQPPSCLPGAAPANLLVRDERAPATSALRARCGRAPAGLDEISCKIQQFAHISFVKS